VNRQNRSMKAAACIALAAMFAFGACKGDPLAKAKSEGKRLLGKTDPMVLSAPSTGDLEISATIAPVTQLPYWLGRLAVPKEQSSVDQKIGMILNYPTFDARVFAARSRGELDALPASWGPTDLDKIRTLALSSSKSIDDAKSPAELEDALLRLRTKAIVNPMGAYDRVDWVTAPSYEGLLCGDFEKGRGMSLLFRPRGTSRPHFRIDFWNVAGATRADILTFLEVLRLHVNHPTPSAPKSDTSTSSESSPSTPPPEDDRRTPSGP
jgi:hypothetical protein